VSSHESNFETKRKLSKLHQYIYMLVYAWGSFHKDPIVTIL